MMHVLPWLRSLLATVFLIIHTVVMSVITIAFAGVGMHGAADRSIRFWARTLLWVFGVRVVLHDFDLVPRNRGVLFLFNHQSHFDILCIAGSIVKRLRFGAKIELFKIPFFGAAMRVSGTLPIVRENPAEVFRVYRDAEKKFAANWSFVLALEGTRQSRPEIGNVKKGPFHFAINAQAPIVPVVIEGAYEVLPKTDLLANKDSWFRTVHIRFLPPIETKGLKSEDIPRLAQETRQRFVETFNSLRAIPD